MSEAKVGLRLWNRNVPGQPAPRRCGASAARWVAEQVGVGVGLQVGVGVGGLFLDSRCCWALSPCVQGTCSSPAARKRAQVPRTGCEQLGARSCVCDSDKGCTCLRLSFSLLKFCFSYKLFFNDLKHVKCLKKCLMYVSIIYALLLLLLQPPSLPATEYALFLIKATSVERASEPAPEG